MSSSEALQHCDSAMDCQHSVAQQHKTTATQQEDSIPFADDAGAANYGSSGNKQRTCFSQDPQMGRCLAGVPHQDRAKIHGGGAIAEAGAMPGRGNEFYAYNLYPPQKENSDISQTSGYFKSDVLSQQPATKMHTTVGVTDTQHVLDQKGTLEYTSADVTDTQGVLFQQKTTQEHHATGRINTQGGLSQLRTTQELTLLGVTNTQSVLHQQRKTQEYPTPGVTKTQDVLDQQKTTQDYPTPVATKDRDVLDQQKSTQEYPTPGVTKDRDVLDQQKTTQEYPTPGVTKDRDVLDEQKTNKEYPTPGVTKDRDVFDQQKTTQEYPIPDGTKDRDVLDQQRTHEYTLRAGAQGVLHQKTTLEYTSPGATNHLSFLHQQRTHGYTTSPGITDTQDLFHQLKTTQEHTAPSRINTQGVFSQPRTTQERTSPSVTNTQGLLHQQRPIQEYTSPEVTNTQGLLHQQRPTQEYVSPDVTNTQGLVLQQGPTQEYTSQGATNPQSFLLQQKRTHEYTSPVVTDTQGGLSQLRTTQEHTSPGVTNTQGLLHQQRKTQEYPTPGVTKDQDALRQQKTTEEYPTPGVTRAGDVLDQQKSTQEHTTPRKGEHGYQMLEIKLSQVMTSLLQVKVNKFELCDTILSEGCAVDKGWLTGNTLRVTGSKEKVDNALSKFFYHYEINDEDFYDDMKHDLVSMQEHMPESVQFMEEKRKYVVCCINKEEVKHQIYKQLKQMKSRTVLVPVPSYVYNLVAKEQEQIQECAKLCDPSWKVTICNTSPEVEICAKRCSIESAVEWFQNFVITLKTAEKRVNHPRAQYIHSIEAHEMVKKMEADYRCMIDFMVDGEQSITATSPNGHQLLLCHGQLAATDCDLIVLPLHAEQKQWSPLEGFVLKRSLLSEDLEMYHRFCRSDPLKLHCHGDYAGQTVVVVPIPEDSGGEKQEKYLITRAFRTVFTNLEDDQHSVGVWLKEWECHRFNTKWMKCLLQSVFEAFHVLGPKACVTVVVYADSPRNTQELCGHLQSGLPKGWRQRPQSQRGQFQVNLMKRKVIVEEGEIQKVEADVVVSSSNIRLQASNSKRSVEKAIFDAAGEGLKKHLRDLFPRGTGIPENGLFATDSFNMRSAKRIFHVALQQAAFSDEKKDTLLHCLHIVIQRCLLKASWEKHRSIAFPLLGTGLYKYPSSDVEDTMISAINKFFTQMPHSSLEKVVIVHFSQKKKQKILQELPIHYTHPSEKNEKDHYFVAVCGHGNVEQILEKICSLPIPPRYTEMAPDLVDLEGKGNSRGPSQPAKKGKHETGSREIDRTHVDALKFLLQDEFDQAFEVKMHNGRCTLSLKEASSADLMGKVESLREDYVPLSAGELAKLGDTVDVSQDGIEAFIKIIPDQGKVAIFAFDFYALSSAKHLVKVKVGQVKVTTRGHRQFGSGNSGLGSSHRDQSSLHSFDPPKAADFFTTSNMKVSVYKADITKLSVDAIVNAANGSLNHAGGVANAISMAAGTALTMECLNYIKKHGLLRVGEIAVTTGGHLSCKVLHAVGPNWYDYTDKERCKRHLFETVFNCLVTADSLECSVIALPSISSAIFGVPQEICADCYLSSVLAFDAHGRKKLNHIHFVDVNNEMVIKIQNAFTTACHSGKIQAGQGHSKDGADRTKPPGRQMKETVPQVTDSSVDMQPASHR